MFENVRPSLRPFKARAKSTLRSLTFALGCATLVFASSHEVHAQERWEVLNQSFESFNNYTPPARWDIDPDSSFVGWKSSTSDMEIWRSGFNNVTSKDGDFHIELNANRAGRISQEICLVAGEIFSWQFAHRARAGGGQMTQSIALTARNAMNQKVQTFATSSLPRPSSNRNDDWSVVTGSQAFIGQTGKYSIGFESDDAGSYGNFIDAINIQPIGLMEFAAASYGDVETLGSNLPQLYISGVVRETAAVTIRVTSATATAGVDFTVAGDNNNDGVGVITIPAGTYDGTPATAVSGLITIINDNLVEGDEILSITLETIAPPALGFAFNTTLQTGDIDCAGPALTTTTYTIVDDDNAPVAMNDSVLGPVSEASVSVDILDNDTDVDGNNTIDPTRVSLITPTGVTVANLQTNLTTGDVTGFDVPGQGTWSYVAADGMLTFTPFAGFVGDPFSVFYSVKDNGPNTSEPAMVSIDYVDPAPQIELTQRVASVMDTNENSIFGDAGDTVTYVYTARNTGDTSLAGVQLAGNGAGSLLDGFDMLDGTSVYTPEPAFDPNAIGYVGLLAQDDGAVQIGTATYVISPADALRGTVSTQPTVTSTAVATATNGTPLPATPLVGPDPVTDISDAASAPQIPAPATPDATSVTIAGIDPDANGAVDAPTVLNLPTPDPRIALIQSVTSVADTNGNGIFGDAGDTVSYSYTAENTGDTSLADVRVDDAGFGALLGTWSYTPVSDTDFDRDLRRGEGPVVVGTVAYIIADEDVAAGEISTQPTIVATAVATGVGNVPLPLSPLSGVDPLRDLSDAGSAIAFDRASGQTTMIDDPEMNDSDGNTGTARGDDRTILALQSPGMGDFILAKTAPVTTVLLGQIVDYQIVATSTLGADLSPVAIVDTLPAGMAFVLGSATVDGIAVVPVVTGQTVTFGGLNMPADAALTVTLKVRVLSTAPAGQLTNSADIIDELSGAHLGETASATVTRQIESVFECSNVIGKVFDDVNGNGYQDAPLVSDAQVSNQDVFADKLGGGGKLSPAAVAPQAEVGIPNVRLVTPSGTLITTDAHGRYSVPCAELPSEIGSNFMLKLDTRTLPTGYRMTTENPRVMRLTSGMMAEMNFGAAIGHVFDVDLSGRAYGADVIAPSAALVTGIEGVLRQISDTPTVIRISYYRDQEAPELARARLAALGQMIHEKWADIGTYRLLVEKSVNQLQ